MATMHTNSLVAIFLASIPSTFEIIPQNLVCNHDVLEDIWKLGVFAFQCTLGSTLANTAASLHQEKFLLLEQARVKVEETREADGDVARRQEQEAKDDAEAGKRVRRPGLPSRVLVDYKNRRSRLSPAA